MNRCIALCLVIACFFACLCTNAFAQGTLRATLEKMDKNDDGAIQPDEITPLARPYLERVAKARRLSLERENDIERWQEAARIYHAIQNGVSGEHIRPKLNPNVKGFGPEEDEPVIPEFGLGHIKYPYSQEDIRRAEKSIARYDRDKDGHLSVEEAARGKWTHLDPFDVDFNNDKLLSRMELTQRYARRRMLADTSEALQKREEVAGSGVKPIERSFNRNRNDRRRDPNAYLPGIIMGRFDENRNGRLEATETLSMGVPAGRIDANRDGILSREELHAYFTEEQAKFEEESEVVPGWFYELDANRDDQIVMTEFTSEWTEEKAKEFSLYDSNADGILTAHEILNSKALVGGSFENTVAEVLPPRKTVISEIEVTDDFIVGDVNLQLSITHSHVMHLDGFLTGPDGTRIELFTSVGGHDDHFENTIFDDQSRSPITKARPPFRGRFLPEGASRRQPGLSSFNGKSIKGIWQLTISGTRNDRFGMLHSWKLMVIPESDLIGGAAPVPSNDGPQRQMANTRGKADRGDDARRKEEARRQQYSQGHEQKTQQRIEQANGWQRQIKERLANKDISGDERKALYKKMEQIEKYKQYMLRNGDKGGWKKGDNSDRRDEKIKQKLRK